MDTYRYQGQIVTLVGEKDAHSTECIIRLPDGTEKTVPQHEITVEHTQEAPAEATKPSQS